jgi:hypothetical protein
MLHSSLFVSFLQEKLEELGGPGSACPVCIEPLTVGDKVVVLPCKGKRHAFHPPCLEPWANKTNTCPVCRSGMGEAAGSTVALAAASTSACA